MDKHEPDFQEIYDTFQPRLLRYMMHLVGESEAEDLTQEILVKVNRALPDFRGDSSLSTWIYRIATHTAIDRLRSRSALTLTSEDQLVRKQMNECIWGFIQALPEHYRTVFILSEVEELSNPAIAEILGITLNTVKIRLHRARTKLKTALLTHCESYWVEGNVFVPVLRL